jgi:hypothetical protein
VVDSPLRQLMLFRTSWVKYMTKQWQITPQALERRRRIKKKSNQSPKIQNIPLDINNIRMIKTTTTITRGRETSSQLLPRSSTFRRCLRNSQVALCNLNSTTLSPTGFRGWLILRQRPTAKDSKKT